MVDNFNENCLHLFKTKTYNNLILTTTNSKISSPISNFIERVITYKPDLNFILDINDESLLCPILCIYKSLMFINFHSFDYHSNFYHYINLAIKQKKDLNDQNVELEDWEENFIQILQIISRKEKPLRLFLKQSIDHPNDLLSFKLGMVMGMSVGDKLYLESLSENYHRLKDNQSLSGFVGIYSFILEELRMFVKSEEWTIKGIELDPNNIWIQHVYCHILYQTNRIKESISFLESKKQTWQEEANIFLNKHIRWHLSVSYMEEEEYSKSNEIIEDIIKMGFDEAECPLSIIGYIIRIFIRTDSLRLIEEFTWIELLLEYLSNLKIYTNHLLFDAFSVWLISYLANNYDNKFSQYNLPSLLDEVCAQIKSNVYSEKIQACNRRNYYEDVYLKIIEAMILFGKRNYKNCLITIFPIKELLWNIGASEEQLFPLFEIILYCSAICQEEDKFDEILKNYFGEELRNLKYVQNITNKLNRTIK